MMHQPDFAPLPPLLDSHANWTDILLQKVGRLAGDTPMMFDAAMQQPLSLEPMYYRSAAWRDRKAQKESEQNLMVGINNRLNVLIQVMGKR